MIGCRKGQRIAVGRDPAYVHRMRALLVLVVVFLFCGCADQEAHPADPFGQPCANDGSAPLESCDAGEDVGWCIAPETGAGICRRACDFGPGGLGQATCPAGETPTMVFADEPRDCYCAPR